MNLIDRERKCPYHNRILVKKVVKEPIDPSGILTLEKKEVVYRVCPKCDYKVMSTEEP
jgi:DNA-directed RNA polymerase subunit RPC12/RpoP